MSNKTYFGPGPSQLHGEIGHYVLDALKEDVGSISHRSGAYKEIHKSAVENLRKLINLPEGFQVLFLGSASEAWERIFYNLVEKKSFHFVNGSFSKKFYEYGIDAGKEAKKLQVEAGKGFDNVSEVEIDADTELISITHNETSTGVQFPLEDIAAIREKYPNALISIDSVSSLPNPKFDFSQFDTLYFSVQKCFGLPAGLGVWLVNEKCIEKAEQLKAKGLSLGAHHSLPELVSKAVNYQTPSTPNVLGIYLLARVTEQMLEYGVENLRKDTKKKQELLHAYIEKSSILSHSVENPAHRSETVVVANTTIPSSILNEKIKDSGLIIGAGYGSFKDTQVRIANFPAHSIEVIEKLIQELEEL